MRPTFYTLYWSCMITLLLVVCSGWYYLGSTRQVLATSAPARPGFVFYRRSQAVVLTLANLLILASIESNNDTIAATIAVRVTEEYSIVIHLGIVSGRLSNGFVLDLPYTILIAQCNSSGSCLTIAQREGERSRGG